MKVGGGLNYVTGPMGAGKTFYGVRRIVAYTMRQQYAVTNVRLHDDWAERCARHFAKFTTAAKRARVADQLRRYYIYEENLQEAMRYRVPGTGEGRAVVVWDEGQNDLNNRNWRDEGRDEILRWGTQLRKLGFIGFLLSQHADNTDVALRRACNFVVRLQNQREQTRMLGIRVTPWPLFLACWYPAHLGLQGQQQRQNIVKVERYFLNWQRHLYDTWGLYHGLAATTEDGAVLLPEGGRERPLCGLAAELQLPSAHGSHRPVNAGSADGGVTVGGAFPPTPSSATSPITPGGEIATAPGGAS